VQREEPAGREALDLAQERGDDALREEHRPPRSGQEPGGDPAAARRARPLE